MPFPPECSFGRQIGKSDSSPQNLLLHLQERPAYDEPVLLKEPAHERLTNAQIAQLHNEYAISQLLAQLPSVRPVYAIDGSESHPILILDTSRETAWLS